MVTEPKVLNKFIYGDCIIYLPLGIILMKRRMEVLMKKMLILLLALFLMACGNNTVNENMNMNMEDEEDEVEVAEVVFNAETLSQYNGLDGEKAYIAIDGIVYDVSEEPLWMDGIHHGRFKAGNDLTDNMKNAPHGLSKLTGLTKVGTYEE